VSNGSTVRLTRGPPAPPPRPRRAPRPT
jgi:hypothetical protein